MKKVLFDFGAIRTGGGAQLATNFIRQLSVHSNSNLSFFAILPSSGPVSHVGSSPFVEALECPGNMTGRFKFERIDVPRFIKKHGIDTVYTFFGAGLPRTGGAKSIVNIAYPVICYPDSPYWRHLPASRKLGKRLKNFIRVRRLRRADTLICETSVMQRRLACTLGRPDVDIQIEPPAVTETLESRLRVQPAIAKNVLLLSGMDDHKNLWRLPSIIQALNADGQAKLLFHLSVTEEQFWSHPRQDRCLRDAVRDQLIFLGAIPPESLQAAYDNADILLSLSDLESFSNNYMEAWKTSVPIMASDRDFAHHICGESAHYGEPHRPESFAKDLAHFAADKVARDKCVEEGIVRLNRLPTQTMRFGRIVHIVNRD